MRLEDFQASADGPLTPAGAQLIVTYRGARTWRVLAKELVMTESHLNNIANRYLGNSKGLKPTNISTALAAKLLLRLNSEPTGGTFKLTGNGHETAAIPFDATPEDISYAVSTLQSTREVVVEGPPDALEIRVEHG